MKKITLLAAAFAVSTFMNAQEPCSQDQPTVDLSGGASVIDGVSNGGQTVANDFILSADTELFTSEGMTLSLLTTEGGTFESIEIAFYEDNAGVPGTQVGATLNITPTSQDVTVEGELSTGVPYELRNVVLDFPSTQVFLGNGTSEQTIYWVSAVGNPVSPSTLVGWENVNSGSTPIIGSSIAFMNSDTEGAFVIGQNENGTFSDGVFMISGECTGGALKSDEKLASQVSLYPNPVNNLLNVTVPSSIQIEGATMYDILGKGTQVEVSANNTINTSSLASGVYLLTINTNEGNITKKVVKQ